LSKRALSLAPVALAVVAPEAERKKSNCKALKSLVSRKEN
jgi:hypothetical protein